MPYEAGSKECRHLIEAKESLLSAMEALSNINSTDLLPDLNEANEVHAQLDALMDLLLDKRATKIKSQFGSF